MHCTVYGAAWFSTPLCSKGCFLKLCLHGPLQLKPVWDSSEPSGISVLLCLIRRSSIYFKLSMWREFICHISGCQAFFAESPIWRRSYSQMPSVCCHPQLLHKCTCIHVLCLQSCKGLLYLNNSPNNLLRIEKNMQTSIKKHKLNSM